MKVEDLWPRICCLRLRVWAIGPQGLHLLGTWMQRVRATMKPQKAQPKLARIRRQLRRRRFVWRSPAKAGHKVRSLRSTRTTECTGFKEL